MIWSRNTSPMNAADRTASDGDALMETFVAELTATADRAVLLAAFVADLASAAHHVALRHGARTWVAWRTCALNWPGGPTRPATRSAACPAHTGFNRQGGGFICRTLRHVFNRHRPPESRTGALYVSEATRILDSRLRTHHKSWNDRVLWNKRNVTGSERSSCLWWQGDVILGQFPALSVPKACPVPRR